MKRRVRLKRYQKKGVRKTVHFGGRILNADEPGLGKTVQTLEYQVRHNKRWPVVVICPSIAKYVWEDQCRQHYGIRAAVLHGRTPPGPGRLPHAKVYVLNYENVAGGRRQTRSWAKVLRGLRPGLVVIDEGHRIKSETAKCTRAVVGVLCKGVKRVVVLTGTPMPNGRPYELWTIAHLLRPDVFHNKYDYLWRYCGPKKGFGGQWTYLGATNVDELNRLLTRYVMIRRRKEDVLGELPAKTFIQVKVDIAHRREYDREQARLVEWLDHQLGRKKSGRASAALRKAKTNDLLSMLLELKAKAVKEWIRDHLDATGGKLLVFGHHRAYLDDLHKSFPGSVLVNGTTPKRERWERTRRFNRDKDCRVMFGNYLAAGTAWSCTSTSTVLLAEPWWVPGDIDQAVSRVRGLGRGLAGVGTTVFAIVAKDTIEEKMWQSVKAKQRNIDRGIDGTASGGDVFKRFERDLLTTRRK